MIVRLLQSMTKTSSPSTLVIWTGNIVVALLFGLMHIPMSGNYFELTPVVVVTILLLNGVGGVTFGWVFWRYGLIMAMLTHFVADIVILVIASPFD